MDFLENTVSKSNQKISIWYSDNVSESKPLSAIFKKYSELVETNLVPLQFFWKKLDSSRVVWAEDSVGNILSVIVFEINEVWQAGYILLAFTEPSQQNQGVSKACFKHYMKQSKEAGMIRTLGIVNINNQNTIVTHSFGERKGWAGGEACYLLLTKRI